MRAQPRAPLPLLLQRTCAHRKCPRLMLILVVDVLPSTFLPRFSLLTHCALGVAFAVLGVAGDLVESTFKRAGGMCRAGGACPLAAAAAAVPRTHDARAQG